MKNKWFLPVVVAFTLLSSHFANATLVRISDGGIVSNLSTETGTVWNIGEGALDGQLLGAFNVELNDGALWDVEFKSGSFLDVFVDASGLDATNNEDANAFSMALVYNVFLDANSFLFDTRYDLTNGCSINMIQLCIVVTPYSADNGSVNATGALNHKMGENGTNVSINSTDTDLVYADWSRSAVAVLPALSIVLGSQTTAVPAPATALFMLLGVIGLVAKRRKA